MRDNKDRAPFHQLIHAALDESLGARIYRRCRLVEDHDGRVGDRRAGYRYQLTLTLRKSGAVALEYGVIAVREHADEAVSICELRRRDALLVGRLGVAVADVLHDSAREQVDILEHDAETAAQIGFLYLVDVYSVIAYLAVRYVIEAVYEVCYRGLARSGRADESHLLTRLCVERDIVKDFLFGCVAEIDMVENDLTLKLCISQSAVAVGMLPCPHSGVLLDFDYLAVLFFRVYEGNISVVGLGLFVHKGEDSLGTREGVDNRVELVRHLGYRVYKVAREHEERGYHAEGQRVDAGQPEILRAGDSHI